MLKFIVAIIVILVLFSPSVLSAQQLPEQVIMLNIGQAVRFTDGSTIQITQTQYPLPNPLFDPPGTPVFAFYATICAASTPESAAQGVFSVISSDSTRALLDVDEKQPQFTDDYLTPNSCDAGWITFLTDGKPVIKIQYSMYYAGVGMETAVWTVIQQ